MKIDHILKTINTISYESIDEVVVPTEHLVTLRREVISLREQLRLAKINANNARAEGLKILANTHLTRQFEEYA